MTRGRVRIISEKHEIDKILVRLIRFTAFRLRLKTAVETDWQRVPPPRSPGTHYRSGTPCAWRKRWAGNAGARGTRPLPLASGRRRRCVPGCTTRTRVSVSAPLNVTVRSMVRANRTKQGVLGPPNSRSGLGPFEQRPVVYRFFEKFIGTLNRSSEPFPTWEVKTIRHEL